MAMLELYLIRHGVAEERGKDWPDDSKRPLTPEGISRLRKSARGLNAIGAGFDQIVIKPCDPDLLVEEIERHLLAAEELDTQPSHFAMEHGHENG